MAVKRRAYLLLPVLVALLLTAGPSVYPYVSVFMRTVLDDETQGAAQTTLGLGTTDSPEFVAVTLSAASEQVIGVLDNNDTDYNIFLGTDVFDNDSGQYNTGMGYQAGYKNDTTGAGTEGDMNVYIGYRAGGETVGVTNKGYWNVGIGYRALRRNQTGYNNVALGTDSLSKLISGTGNFGLGKDAMSNLTEGTENVSIGNSTLGSLSKGNRHVAVGAGIMTQMSTADACTGIGTNALQSVTALGNTGIGYYAGYGIGAGTYNTAVGEQALRYCSGSSNTGIGVTSGRGTNGQSSFSNTVTIGMNSGHDLTTGGSNVFLGYNSGHKQTTNSDLLIIDNQDRGSAANEAVRSLVYGTFAATPEAQELRVNGAMKIANIEDGNYVDIDAQGRVTLYGDARVEHEVAFSLAGIGKGASAPTLVRLGNSVGWAFGISDDGYLSFEVPVSWDSSTGIKIMIHTYVNEAFAVAEGEMRWQGTWSAVPEDGLEPIDGATHTGTLDSGDVNVPAAAKGLLEVDVGVIAAGSLAEHDVVSILLSRIAVNDGNDVTAEPVITEAEYEWYANKHGEQL